MKSERTGNTSQPKARISPEGSKSDSLLRKPFLGEREQSPATMESRSRQVTHHENDLAITTFAEQSGKQQDASRARAQTEQLEPILSMQNSVNGVSARIAEVQQVDKAIAAEDERLRAESGSHPETLQADTAEAQVQYLMERLAETTTHVLEESERADRAEKGFAAAKRLKEFSDEEIERQKELKREVYRELEEERKRSERMGKRAVQAEGQLYDAKEELRIKVKQVTEAEARAVKAEAELRSLRGQRGSDANFDDPHGYYKALGITPAILKGLTQEQIERRLNALRKMHAVDLHSSTEISGHPRSDDERRRDEERLKGINEAVDRLKDPRYR